MWVCLLLGCFLSGQAPCLGAVQESALLKDYLPAVILIHSENNCLGLYPFLDSIIEHVETHDVQNMDTELRFTLEITLHIVEDKGIDGKKREEHTEINRRIILRQLESVRLLTPTDHLPQNFSTHVCMPNISQQYIRCIALS